jgi:hypothetical protein
MGWIGSPCCQPESHEGKRDADASARSHVLDPSFPLVVAGRTYIHMRTLQEG